MEDDLVVEFYPLKHPGGSFAYKFTQNGRVFIFATDAEFTGEILEKIGDETDFFRNADVLVLDAQYTLDEAFMKIDWGHTGYTMAVNCGLRWKTKHLVMTHHEPAYSDLKLRENHEMALEHRNNNGDSVMKISLAREGMIFEL
jgi:ribonuclease BN (tRNA processing enzyme)